MQTQTHIMRIDLLLDKGFRLFPCRHELTRFHLVFYASPNQEGRCQQEEEEIAQGSLKLHHRAVCCCRESKLKRICQSVGASKKSVALLVSSQEPVTSRSMFFPRCRKSFLLLER